MGYIGARVRAVVRAVALQAASYGASVVLLARSEERSTLELDDTAVHADGAQRRRVFQVASSGLALPWWSRMPMEPNALSKTSRR
jgi:NAD(P)-dependent dehydrogenase (short-subunit alcohol dehydrogenase family)